MDEKHQELIKSVGKYWSEKEPEKLFNILSEKFTYEDVSTGTISHTREDLKAFMDGIYSMAPDIKYILKSCFVSNNKGCSEWVMVGTQTGPLQGGLPATNKKFEVKGASVYTFEGDKIKSCADYCDMMTLFKQIGVIKN